MQMLLQGSAVVPQQCQHTTHRLTSGQQANVSEEGVVDLEGVERVQASMVDGGHQDVLLTLAAAASCTLRIYLSDML